MCYYPRCCQSEDGEDDTGMSSELSFFRKSPVRSPQPAMFPKCYVDSNGFPVWPPEAVERALALKAAMEKTELEKAAIAKEAEIHLTAKIARENADALIREHFREVPPTMKFLKTLSTQAYIFMDLETRKKIVAKYSTCDSAELQFHTTVPAHPNIVQFLSYNPGLQLEGIQNVATLYFAPMTMNLNQACHKMSMIQAKQAMYQLLLAVQHCHQNGFHFKNLYNAHVLINLYGIDGIHLRLTGFNHTARLDSAVVDVESKNDIKQVGEVAHVMVTREHDGLVYEGTNAAELRSNFKLGNYRYRDHFTEEWRTFLDACFIVENKATIEQILAMEFFKEIEMDGHILVIDEAGDMVQSWGGNNADLSDGELSDWGRDRREKENQTDTYFEEEKPEKKKEEKKDEDKENLNEEKDVVDASSVAEVKTKTEDLGRLEKKTPEEDELEKKQPDDPVVELQQLEAPQEVSQQGVIASGVEPVIETPQQLPSSTLDAPGPPGKPSDKETKPENTSKKIVTNEKSVLKRIASFFKKAFCCCGN